MSGAAARELKNSQQSQLKEFLAPGLEVGIKCFIYWGPVHLRPSTLVFMHSHHNLIYFSWKLIDKSSTAISLESHEMKHALQEAANYICSTI